LPPRLLLLLLLVLLVLLVLVLLALLLLLRLVLVGVSSLLFLVRRLPPSVAAPVQQESPWSATAGHRLGLRRRCVAASNAANAANATKASGTVRARDGWAGRGARAPNAARARRHRHRARRGCSASTEEKRARHRHLTGLKCA